MGLSRASLALAAALLAGELAAAAPDVTVVGDLTKEGRKIAHPTPEHPAFYQPVMRGAQEIGDPASSDPPVSPHLIAHMVAVELAKRGYLAISALHPKPDLVIDIAWGYIGPAAGDPTNTLDTDGATSSAKTKKEMNNLVLGHTVADVMPLESFNRQQFLEAAKQNRYFLILTAYDYAAFAQKNNHLLLWRTNMSVPTTGVYLSDVLVSLVNAGGPLFGNETVNHPKLQAVPEGHVEVGTPVEKSEPTVQPVAPPK